MKPTNGATRVVLILFSITLCAGLFLGKVSQEQFVNIATIVISFYFGNKAGMHGSEIRSTEGKQSP